MRMICKLWLDRRGQDLIEYALLGAFVASCAGCLSPNVASGISTMFSRVTSAINVSQTYS
jgi:Flp pilus assembly pilin Flp